jgi:transcriptional antiterminator NusG
MWYVIQTQTGHEDKIKTMMDRTRPEGLDCRCELFFYESKRRYLGAWNTERKLLFPGYVIAITDDIQGVSDHLKLLPEYSKVLKHGDEMVPLAEDEVSLIRRLTGDDGVMSMSYGIQVGDKVRGTDGALVGMEYRILKIDRHKRKAVIEIELFKEKKEVTVGLEILEKVKDN